MFALYNTTVSSTDHATERGESLFPIVWMVVGFIAVAAIQVLMPVGKDISGALSVVKCKLDFTNISEPVLRSESEFEGLCICRFLDI